MVNAAEMRRRHQERKNKYADGGGVDDWVVPVTAPAIAPADDWAAPAAPAAPTQPPAAPDIGYANAFGHGAAQGATANFYDELRGLMEAGGLNPKDPASLTALVKGAYKYWTGDKEAEQRYDTAAGRERKAYEEAQKQYPGTTLAGNLAGAVAIPVGPALSAPTLGGRMLKGALAGAGYGAAYGAGEGVGAEDRASRAASGALVGGIAGGVAPPIIEGAAALTERAAAPIMNVIRGADPEKEAGRRIISAIQRDVKSGQAGLSPSELIASIGRGDPVAIMDMGGETTRALGRSAANTSPEARAALNRVINDRFETQGARAVEAVRSLVPTHANASKTREALEAAAQTARQPFYNKAFRDGSAGIWDDQLAALAEAPPMQRAMKEAVNSIQTKAVSGRNVGPIQNNGKPTLEFWDQVKRTLDSQYKVLSRAGDKEAAADIQAIKSFLVQKLDDAVPSYPVARGVASELFRADNALESGEKFVTTSLKNAEVRKALGRMGPEERALFAEGFASKLVDTIREMPDRRNAINGLLKSPAVRERVEMALGQNGLQKLEGFVARETLMDLWRFQMGNSTTVRQLIEAGLAGGAYGAITGNWDASTLMTAAIVYGARRGQMKIDENVARKVGEMLSSQDPRVLQKGLNAVANSPNILRALTNAEFYLTRAVAQQSPKSLMLEAPVVSRADGDKPEVPRPPSQ